MIKDTIKLVLDNKVPQCDLESDLCARSTAELIREVLSIASFFINLVHFILLSMQFADIERQAILVRSSGYVLCGYLA